MSGPNLVCRKMFVAFSLILYFFISQFIYISRSFKENLVRIIEGSLKQLKTTLFRLMIPLLKKKHPRLTKKYRLLYLKIYPYKNISVQSQAKLTLELSRKRVGKATANYVMMVAQATFNKRQD